MQTALFLLLSTPINAPVRFSLQLHLSLPKTLSTTENRGFSPDGRNRDVPIRVPLATAGCDLQLRRMEFLVGTPG